MAAADERPAGAVREVQRADRLLTNPATTAGVDARRAHRVLRTSRTRDAWALVALVSAFAIAYSAYGLFRHWHFDSGAYDMGIFDQVVWHLSRLEAPSTTVRGHTNMFGDHFSPVLMLLAPVYWIAPGPESLILSQAVLLALSIVPVFLFVRRRLSRGPAYGLAAAYGLFWGMQRAVAFDFHEVAFAPLVIATAILAIDEQRWPLFWTMLLALVAIKEDLIPVIGGFGLLLAIQGRVRAGIAAIVMSSVAFAIVLGFVIPSLSDAAEFSYVGPYATVIQHPWLIPAVFFTPAVKLRTTLSMFAPFVFLPLLSPLVILIVPIAAVRFLSSAPNHWGTAFHYWAPVAPILAMGAADGLARIEAWLHRRGHESGAILTARVCTVACVLLSATIPGHQPILRLARASTYRAPAFAASGHIAVGLIPPDASVTAQNSIVPHLSGRERLYVLDASAPDTEFLIATERLDPWPLNSIDELRALVEAHRRRGYQPVFERDGWIILHRPIAPSP